MQRIPSTTHCRTEPQANHRHNRTGLLSAELIMVLPVFAIVLFGLLEFSLLFFARGELAEASRVGARKATLPGVTAEEVESEVRAVLSPRLQDSLQVQVESGQRSGDVVTVALAVDMTAASPDLLWPIGYSLTNRKLYEITKMIRE
ncbi:MAG: TadE/TadG family type IV pilus assembly protein [Planctomycetota bacterium]|jgi:Flp pilus assembly protein TadG